MKTYTPEERDVALKKLPLPIADFVKSRTLVLLYLGIMEKNKLDIRQSGILTNLANLTLLGLEPENELEHNLHQELPELENVQIKSIVEDLGARVFTEARRRLQENKMENDTWDENELGPRPSPNESSKPQLNEDELDKLADIEEAEALKNPPSEVDEEESEFEDLETTEEPKNSTAIATSKLEGATEIKSEITEVTRPIQKIIAPPRLKGDADPYREIPD